MRSFYVCALFMSGMLLLSSDCASAARMDDSNDDMDWMDPIHELKAKLGHTGGKLREKWSKMKPARIMKHALKDLKNLPHEVKMYTIVHTLQAGKLDVRRIDAPGELLSKDFCRFVRHLHRNTEHSDPDAAVLFFFRTRLLENEVAILISRAKLFEENAVHMQKALFKQWFQRKLDVNGVKELFTKPYAWQWGDDVYVQDIVSSYRKYLHHRRRSTARHAG
ncbi:unnamed protein product [Hyaloperonospora brassicae]|uniref:RxLR effector candidate protein n=1 Tax=Hyaloperonospora brassicae TaxID=162125 RepID=A0AAV0TMM3_HYABA|nr:unnamed protein product [Hyaloperonospora brassicae]